MRKGGGSGLSIVEQSAKSEGAKVWVKLGLFSRVAGVAFEHMELA
jgi:hypothetical protein